MKAGAVIGPDGDHALLKIGRDEHAGIYRQIAALGMSSQPQLFSGKPFRHGCCIRNSQLLRGDLRHTGQLQILPPTRQRIIGAAKSAVHGMVAGLNGQRRELFPFDHIQMTGKTTELHGTEADRTGHFPKHIGNGVRNQNPHINGFPVGEAGEKALCRISEGDTGAVRNVRNDACEIHIRQLGQNQIVHFVERRALKRQIASPCRISEGDTGAVRNVRNDACEIHIRQLGQNQIVHFVERRALKRQIASPIQIVQQISHEHSSCGDGVFSSYYIRNSGREQVLRQNWQSF